MSSRTLADIGGLYSRNRTAAGVGPGTDVTAVGSSMGVARDGRRAVAGGFREALALSASAATFLWTSGQHRRAVCVFRIISCTREILKLPCRLLHTRVWLPTGTSVFCLQIAGPKPLVITTVPECGRPPTKYGPCHPVCHRTPNAITNFTVCPSAEYYALPKFTLRATSMSRPPVQHTHSAPPLSPSIS